MIPRKNHRRASPILIVFAVALGLAVYAGAAAVGAVSQAAQTGVWGSPESGLILTYRTEEGQVLRYQMIGEQTESNEIQGQVIEAQTSSTGEIAMTAKPESAGNLVFDVSLDSMEMNIQSTQGDFSPDLTPILGKSFEMTLTPLGEELDVSGAKAIEFEMPGAGKRNIASRFLAFFPNLPSDPVKIGDTFSTSDAIQDDSDQMSVNIQLENMNTIEGFETIDGMECVRIKAQVSGTVTGQGSQQGIDLTIDGTYEGEDTWYFAYKTGVFVKLISEGTVKGMVAAGPPANLDIPMTQTMSQEISLIK